MIYLLRFLKADKNFFVLEEDDDEDLAYFPKEGKEINIKSIPDGDFFFYKEENKFHIAEGFSGEVISSSKSFKLALILAEEKLNDKNDFVKNLLERLKVISLSPRFISISNPWQ